MGYSVQNCVYIANERFIFPVLGEKLHILSQADRIYIDAQIRAFDVNKYELFFDTNSYLRNRFSVAHSHLRFASQT